MVLVLSATFLLLFCCCFTICLQCFVTCVGGVLQLDSGELIGGEVRGCIEGGIGSWRPGSMETIYNDLCGGGWKDLQCELTMLCVVQMYVGSQGLTVRV